MVNSKVRNSFFVWIISILFFSSIVFINYFSGILNKNSVALFVFLGPILIGVISFIIFLFSSISYLLKKKWFKKWDSLNKIVKFFLIILIFPLLLFFDVFNLFQIIKNIKKKSVISVILTKLFWKNFAFAVLVVLFLFPTWGVSYFVSLYVPATLAGLVTTPIPIAGTGSMYPTFPKGYSKDPKELGEETVATPGMLPYPNGLRILEINIFGHEIEKGDVIVFENNKTKEITTKDNGKEAGFVKRVIALHGDEIMIKDGLVYLNGKISKEPYIARARSTFGGEFLSDCKPIKIPKNKLFVMGDNRKASDDSRIEVGLVDYKDIRYVLPFKDQLGKLDKGWHDPKNDDKESARIILDKNKYLDLLNKERAKLGLKSLVYENKLELSAEKRGENMLKFDDFSYTATRSGYTQVRAMNDVGYSNIVWNEGIVQGNYEADELIEYLFESADWKKNLLEEKDFQAVGISEVEGELNGCPAQVIVQHFAGYVPPNYTAEDIQSWGSVINNLNEVIPSWERAKDWSNVNQDSLNKLIGLMYQRKNQAEAVYYRMKANQWLTDQEIKYTKQDTSLFNQSDALAKKLNGN